MVPGGDGWSMESSREERPRMSDSRMNSWRVLEHFWPVWVRKVIAAVHSGVDRRVSRAKSCRWVTSRSKM